MIKNLNPHILQFPVICGGAVFIQSVRLQPGDRGNLVSTNMNDFLNIDISLGKYLEMEYNSRSEKSRKAG